MFIFSWVFIALIYMILINAVIDKNNCIGLRIVAFEFIIVYTLVLVKG